jgi:hypothetical protein
VFMFKSVVTSWYFRPYSLELDVCAMPGLVSFDSLKSQLRVVFAQCDYADTWRVVLAGQPSSGLAGERLAQRET